MGGRRRRLRSVARGGRFCRRGSAAARRPQLAGGRRGGRRLRRRCRSALRKGGAGERGGECDAASVDAARVSLLPPHPARRRSRGRPGGAHSPLRRVRSGAAQGGPGRSAHPPPPPHLLIVRGCDMGSNPICTCKQSSGLCAAVPRRHCPKTEAVLFGKVSRLGFCKWLGRSRDLPASCVCDAGDPRQATNEQSTRTILAGYTQRLGCLAAI